MANVSEMLNGLNISDNRKMTSSRNGAINATRIKKIQRCSFSFPGTSNVSSIGSVKNALSIVMLIKLTNPTKRSASR
jgi:hypothetical protein